MTAFEQSEFDGFCHKVLGKVAATEHGGDFAPLLLLLCEIEVTADSVAESSITFSDLKTMVSAIEKRLGDNTLAAHTMDQHPTLFEDHENSPKATETQVPDGIDTSSSVINDVEFPNVDDSSLVTNDVQTTNVNDNSSVTNDIQVPNEIDISSVTIDMQSSNVNDTSSPITNYVTFVADTFPTQDPRRALFERYAAKDFACSELDISQELQVFASACEWLDQYTKRF